MLSCLVPMALAAASAFAAATVIGSTAGVDLQPVSNHPSIASLSPSTLVSHRRPRPRPRPTPAPSGAWPRHDAADKDDASTRKTAPQMTLPRTSVVKHRSIPPRSALSTEMSQLLKQNAVFRVRDFALRTRKKDNLHIVSFELRSPHLTKSPQCEKVVNASHIYGPASTVGFLATNETGGGTYWNLTTHWQYKKTPHEPDTKLSVTLQFKDTDDHTATHYFLPDHFAHNWNSPNYLSEPIIVRYIGPTDFNVLADDEYGGPLPERPDDAEHRDRDTYYPAPMPQPEPEGSGNGLQRPGLRGLVMVLLVGVIAMGL